MSYLENKKEEDKLYDFEQWRTMHFEYSLIKCLGLQKKDIDDDIESHNLSILPKCLIHFTRMMCDCSQECIQRSFIRTNSYINTTCKIYDTENMWLDDTYKNCQFLDVIVLDGKFVKMHNYKIQPELGNEIMNDIEELCDSEGDFYNLRCKAYKLRDLCQNMPRCINFYLQKFRKQSCPNYEYENQIKSLERILNFEFIINKKEIESLFFDKLIKSSFIVDENNDEYKSINDNITDEDKDINDNIIYKITDEDKEITYKSINDNITYENIIYKITDEDNKITYEDNKSINDNIIYKITDEIDYKNITDKINDQLILNKSTYHSDIESMNEFKKVKLNSDKEIQNQNIYETGLISFSIISVIICIIAILMKIMNYKKDSKILFPSTICTLILMILIFLVFFCTM